MRANSCRWKSVLQPLLRRIRFFGLLNSNMQTQKLLLPIRRIGGSQRREYSRLPCCSAMDEGMALCAESDQILFGVVVRVAAKFLMVDL
jgi:hypothetical protein